MPGLRLAGFGLAVGGAVYGGDRVGSVLFGLFVFAMTMHCSGALDEFLRRPRLRPALSFVLVPGAGSAALYGALVAWDRWWLASLCGFFAATFVDNAVLGGSRKWSRARRSAYRP